MANRYSAKSSISTRGVSQARLGQRSGSRHAFGGYTKVNNGNGSFTMKKTSR